MGQSCFPTSETKNILGEHLRDVFRLRRENEMPLMVHRVYGNVSPSDFGIRFCFSNSVRIVPPSTGTVVWFNQSVRPTPSANRIRQTWSKPNRQPKVQKLISHLINTHDREREVSRNPWRGRVGYVGCMGNLPPGIKSEFGQDNLFQTNFTFMENPHLVRQCSQPFNWRSPVCKGPMISGLQGSYYTPYIWKEDVKDVFVNY